MVCEHSTVSPGYSFHGFYLDSISKRRFLGLKLSNRTTYLNRGVILNIPDPSRSISQRLFFSFPRSIPSAACNSGSRKSQSWIEMWITFVWSELEKFILEGPMNVRSSNSSLAGGQKPCACSWPSFDSNRNSHGIQRYNFTVFMHRISSSSYHGATSSSLIVVCECKISLPSTRFTIHKADSSDCYYSCLLSQTAPLLEF